MSEIRTGSSILSANFSWRGDIYKKRIKIRHRTNLQVLISIIKILVLGVYQGLPRFSLDQNQTY